MTAPFSWSESERRLGKAAAAAADQLAAEAPPMSVEVREQLRALFATARGSRPVTRPAKAA
ncbi:hypothetical protein [Streptomyces sp. NPDC003299]